MDYKPLLPKFMGLEHEGNPYVYSSQFPVDFHLSWGARADLDNGLARVEEGAKERMVTSDATRALVQSRNYCTDRLAELKADIARCRAEDAELKSRLETVSDEVDAGTIRRRRRYLSRYIEERKVERTALTKELETSTEQLRNLPR